MIPVSQAAFPTLTDDQMAMVANIGRLVHFEADQVMIDQGQKGYPFFVIVSGTVRIVELSDETCVHIVNHGPGEFTGDVDMLTGRSAVITAIANEPVIAYQLDDSQLRRLLNACQSINDVLLRAIQLRRKLLADSDFVGVRVIGETKQPETARLLEFLYKNHVPHRFFDASSQEGIEQKKRLSADQLPLPVIHCNGQTVGDPSLARLADCIGISRNVEGHVFDLVIVGAGPAGLAAAVYASSEGIKTLVIDKVGPGGQAGSSSRIENFIGFPSGISGGELANRGYLQALKFGAQFIAPISVNSISTDSNGQHELHLCTGQSVKARCILVASGVTYRQIGVDGVVRFEGAGLYYAATSSEARVCENGVAVIVGGGNSAGQAAMFLANTSSHIKMIIRSDSLSKSMSSYLCDRVLAHPKIEVMTNSEIEAIKGEEFIERVSIRDHHLQHSYEIDCSAVFCFIGAQPHTSWLPKELALDDKGFILTGSSIPRETWARASKLDRAPCDLETSIPGIMAAGDVRAGSTKRCGFAVGDGSMAVTCIHRYLAILGSLK